MAKDKPLKDEDLAVIIKHAITEGENFTSTKMSRERETVSRYYAGELPLPMHKGDSKYVSRDVFEHVDSVRATIGETFLAHSRIVRFQPEKGETVDDSAQATEYCRHVLFKDNPGEDIIYSVLTDGLMNRFSTVKVYVEEVKNDMEYEFEALTEEELTQFVSGFEDYEFTEASTSEDTGLYSGTVKDIHSRKVIRVEVLPPEDFSVTSNTTTIQSAKAAIHKATKTKSDLLKEGFDKGKVDALTYDAKTPSTSDYETQQRHEAIGSILGGSEEYQDAQKEVDVFEVYINLDMEGEGTTKLWKVTYASETILDKERVSRVPCAAFVPIPRPHTFFGENFALNLVPVQNARTILTRQIINHALMTNNSRTQVLNGTVRNPAELLDNRFGGIVNVNRMDGISPLPQGVLNPYVFSLLQKIEADSEGVSGVSKLSQGLNKDAISTQNSQGMVEQLIDASQRRQKLMARRFGLFIRELYHLIYHTAVDHIEEAEYVSVTGQYVEVNPIEWKDRTAASIELTLGYGEQEAEANKFIELDQYLQGHPILSRGYDPEKAYAVITQALERRGIEDIQSYLTPPSEVPPPEPSEADTLQLEMLKAQVEYTKAQSQAMVMKAETDRMNAQTAQMKVQTDASVKVGKLDLDGDKLEHAKVIDHAELEAGKQADQTRGIFNPKG